MQKEITQTWFFTQTQQEVWDYLTKPELMEQWLMRSDFKPVQGHRFRFMFTPKEGSDLEGTITGEVLEVKPCTQLSYSWDGRIASDGRPFNSVVVWTLAPKEGGTELRLQHTGFAVLEDVRNHSTGWVLCVKRLQDSLNEMQHDNAKP